MDLSRVKPSTRVKFRQVACTSNSSAGQRIPSDNELSHAPRYAWKEIVAIVDHLGKYRVTVEKDGRQVRSTRFHGIKVRVEKSSRSDSFRSHRHHRYRRIQVMKHRAKRHYTKYFIGFCEKRLNRVIHQL